MKIESKYLVLATICGAAVALDQLTKMYIHSNFSLGESITVIENYFKITYVRNTGAAFGIFATGHELARKVFFLTMPPIAMIIIFAILRGVQNNDRWQILSLSLIFGGALGNYIDRLRFGFVVDFLDFHLGNFYSWPAFNVADSCIVTGVCLLMFLMIRQDFLNKKKASS